ncbi:MAG: hypothetical protein HOY75_08095 [Streptomyces sp.]|nr:hypothetical protein [Streptomyces sp.]
MRRIPPPRARRRPRNRIHPAYRHRTQPRDVRGRYASRPGPPPGCMVLFVAVFTIVFVVIVNR